MAKIQFIFKIDNNESFFLLKRECFFIFHNFRSKKVILPFCHNKVNFVFFGKIYQNKATNFKHVLYKSSILLHNFVQYIVI